MRAASQVLLLMAGVTVAAACRDAVHPERIPPLPVSFVFVSGAPGLAQIYRWYADSVVPLTTGPGENVEPAVSAGRMVFTSYRDGNAEIYLSNLDGSDQHRVTASTAFDYQADLSADATRLVFVSSRTGAERLYVSDSSGSGVIALATGSAAGIPETSPAWSPNGLQVAFASSRSGTSQVYVVAATGGEATQMTFESIGAFEPAWSPGGDTLFYIASAATTQLRALRVSDKSATTLASTQTGYRQPTCGAFGCIAVRTARTDGSGELVALQSNGRRVSLLFAADSTNRDPAVIR